MGFFNRQLGSQKADPAALKEDKRSCRRIGPAGIGKKYLFLNSFYFDRVYYVPISSVKRVYKRVAMSKGGFTGKGIFASIPYLVVEYENNREKQCNFRFEEKVDQFVAAFHSEHPQIPIHSAAAEKKLREKEERFAKRFKKNLPREVSDEVRRLDIARKFLEERPELYTELAASSRAFRINQRSNPAYKWVALAIVLMGVVAAAFGIVSLVTHRGGMSIYFLLFGMAAIFLFSGANVLPTRKNNRRYIQNRMQDAEKKMAAYISDFPGFPVPAGYAHPGVLEWMSEILREGKASTADQALVVLKKELKGLNADVTVEQDEFERIMAIKPMFLVRDYE